MRLTFDVSTSGYVDDVIFANSRPVEAIMADTQSDSRGAAPGGRSVLYTNAVCFRARCRRAIWRAPRHAVAWSLEAARHHRGGRRSTPGLPVP